GRVGRSRTPWATRRSATRPTARREAVTTRRSTTRGRSTGTPTGRRRTTTIRARTWRPTAASGSATTSGRRRTHPSTRPTTRSSYSADLQAARRLDGDGRVGVLDARVARSGRRPHLDPARRHVEGEEADDAPAKADAATGRLLGGIGLALPEQEQVRAPEEALHGGHARLASAHRGGEHAATVEAIAGRRFDAELQAALLLGRDLAVGRELLGGLPRIHLGVGREAGGLEAPVDGESDRHRPPDHGPVAAPLLGEDHAGAVEAEVVVVLGGGGRDGAAQRAARAHDVTAASEHPPVADHPGEAVLDRHAERGARVLVPRRPLFAGCDVDPPRVGR